MSIFSRTNSRGGAVAGACVLLAALTACAKQPTADELIAEARQMQGKRDLQGAIIQLKNALQLNPGNTAARLLLAGVYNDAGDPLSAEKEARKAVTLGLDQAKAMPVLAEALLRQGKYAAMLKETAPAEGAPAPEIQLLRGRAHLGLGDLPAARQQFDEVLRSRPKDVGATTGLAQVAALERDMERADLYAAQAVAEHPDDINAWMVKANLERVQGRTEAAEKAYDGALKLNPADGDAHLQKAYLYIDARKFDAAASELALYKKVANGSLLLPYTQALLAYRQGDAAAALGPLQQVLKVAPGHLPSLLLAGAVQFKLGAIAQAELHLAKYLDGDPGNLSARKLLVSTLLQAKRPADAQVVLAPALKAPDPDAYVLALAAEIATQSGEFAQASAYYERASALAPKMAALRTSLGLSLLGAGDPKRALSELERATAIDTGSLPIGLALVRTALGLKRYDQALAGARKLAAAHPANADVTFLTGAAEVGLHQAAAARASFEQAQRLRPRYYEPVASLALLDVAEGKPDAARARLVAYLEQDKGNMDAMTVLSALAGQRGDAAEATAWLEKSLAAHPDAVYPALRLATNLLDRRLTDRGLTLARKTSAANPGNTDALDVLGQAQLSAGKPVDAVETYSQMIKLLPASALARYHLAGAQAQAGKDADAMASLKKTLQIEPGHLEAKLALAGLAVRSGDVAQALTLARELQRQRPKSPAGLLLEGDLLAKQNKLAPATAAYERALALAPDAVVKIKLAYVMSTAGKGAEAEQRLARWIKEAPSAPDTVGLRLYLAQLGIAGERYAQAAAQLEAVLAAEGKAGAPTPAVIAEATNNLAYVYQQLKDPRALPTAEKALALAPADPAVMDTAGWLLVERGDTGRGVPLLRKAAALAPSSAVHYHLAQGLLRAGDKPGAKKLLEDLLAGDAHFPQADGARSLLKQL
ncbi:putative PEP-CTERM system TPR-repeat lipoprotein [Duganella sp. 1411]|uniref:XrtA/PEP-CTERM system TPR-repeat protein PrsT n=1 Tax=Duganella sp. 1411 TaxID=2806572 RepID=UPI001AE40212|nr:XrtA/PEP-CTERM system TPR-repeat protein PrsT [Duganella sp. 1411]MBP1202284.1 putative PEP-CTERM system TPR-repeat lipoprotein [Duganella sp. 1411]